MKNEIIIKQDEKIKVSKIDIYTKCSYLYEDGNLKCEIYCIGNKRNNYLNIPAYQEYYMNGNLKRIEHYKNGKLHNDKNPAIKNWDATSNIESEYYYINGLLNRCGDQPVKIFYYLNGNIRLKQWFVNNKLHNLNKPAVIVYNYDNKILNQEYWINGKILNNVKNEKDFKKYKLNYIS